MPLRNLKEDHLYDLLPPVVAELDTRKLIQAVVGGLQDRVADLRSYGSRLAELLDPTYVDRGVVLVTFTTDAGVTTQVSLDPQPDTPTTGGQLLISWAAEQLGIDAGRITQAVVGSDMLRYVTIDTLQLLAATVGATLYPGPAGESAADTATRRRQIVSTYFPRLKFKGASRSWVGVAKLSGFDDATMVPLWSRYSGDDGRAEADFLPSSDSAELTTLNDGPWVVWNSGSLYSDPANPAYFTSINGRNPLIQLVAYGSVVPPPVGTYVLTDGAAQRRAQVRLTDGTIDSQLVAQSIGFGADFDRTSIVVTGQNDWRSLSVAGWQSSLKFRSSTFDASVFRRVEQAGTVSVGPNPALRAGLVLPDGTPSAPWRPWSGGSGAPVTQTLWPNRSVSVGAVVAPRAPAPSTASQIDASALAGDAANAFSSLSEVQTATRLPRRLGFGLTDSDQAEFRAYPGAAVLGVGPGVLAGTVVPALRPSVDSVASFTLDGQDVKVELVGTVCRLIGQVTGAFDNRTAVWSASLSQAGTLVAIFHPTDSSYLPPVSGISSPRYLTIPAGTTYSPVGTYQTSDEAPWLRYRPVMTGGQADVNTFLPAEGDTAAVAAPAVVLAPNQAGLPTPLVVRDLIGYQAPYRVMAGMPSQSLVNEPFRPAMATFNGSHYPVTVVHGAAVVSSIASNQARRRGQRLWWWLGEDATNLLEVTDLSTGVVSPLDGAVPSQRRLDPVRGWYLQGPGSAVSPAIELEPDYLFAGWFKPASPGQLGRAGQVSLQATLVGTQSDLRAVLEPAAGTTVSTNPVRVGNGTWTYAAAGWSGGELRLRARVGKNVWQESSAKFSQPIATRPLVELTLPSYAAASDVGAWVGGKTTAELEQLVGTIAYPTSVAWPTSAVPSVRGDHYVLTATVGGQVLPGTITPDPGLALVPATVYRYDSSGSYIGDPEYKLVGLGQDSGLDQRPLRLGERGVFVPATGRHIAIGANPSLPAYTFSWVGTNSSARYQVTPPYGSTGGLVGSHNENALFVERGLNTVLDRIYLRGSADGSLYQCKLDDFGGGPVFTVDLPTRTRSNGSTLNQPTDHAAVFAFDNLTLGVTNGQVTMNPSFAERFVLRETTFGYILTEAGSRVDLVVPQRGLLGDFNMYLRSRQRVYAPVAAARWANRPAGVDTATVPNLATAGQLTFINTEAVAAGTVRLTFTIGNDGWLDDDFPGFDIAVNVDGPGSAPVTAQATWLAGAKGNNATGQAEVELVLPAAVTGPWNLTVNWSNPRNLPARGRQRHLKIYGYEVREVKSKLCQITLSPFSVGTIAVDTALPDLQPGAWVGRVGNNGTTTVYTHEVNVYSPNADGDVVPRVSASDSLTGCSLGRFSQLDLLNPTLAPISTTPIAPIISSVGTWPTSPTYNVGDRVTLTGTATGDLLRYAWRLWSYGSTASYDPAVTATFNRGGPAPWKLLAVDRLGQTAETYGTIYVNQPPLIQLATAVPNNLPAPYSTTLRAVITDAELQPVNVTWQADGSIVAYGTNVGGFMVDRTKTVTVVAVDSAGGTSTSDLTLLANQNQKPQVALSAFTERAKAGWNSRLKFAAVAQDPENRGLTAVWRWWDGATSAGYAQAMPQFGNGTLFTAERDAVATAGYKLFDVTVTDGDGLVSAAGAGVTFIANHPPQIAFAKTSANAVAAGQPLYLSASASDPDGDTLSYVWDIVPLGLKLYGPNAALDTFGFNPGTSLSIKLTVDDGFGGIATETLDSVTVADPESQLNPITIDPPSGIRTSGSIVTIASPDDSVNIRYTINGGAPFTENDGLPYTSPFMLGYSPGKVVTLQARAFKGTYAPSDSVAVIYDFGS